MKYIFLVSGILLFFFSSCKKEQIAPANQKDAFVKYYGHIRDHQASDLKPTADGGYIMIGSANSFAATSDDDFFLVKADSLGNEEWSKTFGDGEGGFDEEGVSIVVLANEEGYLIAGNRTKMVLVNGQPRPESTNIVLYKLDLEGNVVWEKVLRPNVGAQAYNEYVKDVKQNPDGTFILIGETTNVNTTKNEYTLYSAYDLQDILVLKLNADGVQIWESKRGFVGLDYGASVHFVNGNFVITGSVDVRSGGTPSAPNFLKQMIVATLSGITGTEINAQYFGMDDQFVTTAYSCYDSVNGVITVLAHVEDLPTITDPKEGDIMVLQVGENLIEITSKYYGKTSGGINGIDQNLTGGSIALVPPQVQGDRPSVIITANHGVGNGGSECVLIKLDQNMDPDWGGNARFFGRPGENGNWLPGNSAKTVFPVEQLVEGTTRKVLQGYAFTATFNMGTNNMIGLVKTNPDGEMKPF